MYTYSTLFLLFMYMYMYMYGYTCIVISLSLINQKSPRKGEYDDIPPPVPTKKGSRASTTAGLIATPTLPHSHPMGGHLDAPLPPLRIDSIAGLRSKLETQQGMGGVPGGVASALPNKPPRVDSTSVSD